MTSKTWATVALIVLLIIILFGWWLAPTDALPVREWGVRLESAGLPGVFFFLLGGMLATAVGLPRQLLAFTGGLAYGTASGLVLSLLAAIAGCACTFIASRYLLQLIVTRRFPAVIAWLEKLLRDDVWLKIVILRLQPLGTNLATNLSAGVTSLSAPTFLSASAVGYIPQMLVFVLIGSGVRVGSSAQLLVSAILLMISVVLGIWLYRRHVERRNI